MENKKLRVGDKVGKWVLLKEAKLNNKLAFTCQCECGLVKNVDAKALREKRTKGCRQCAYKTTIKRAIRATQEFRDSLKYREFDES